MADAKNYTPPPQQQPGWRRTLGTVVKPKDFKGTLKRIWSLVNSQRRALIGVFVLSGFISIAAMLTPFLIGKVIDHIKLNGADRISNTAITLILVLLFCYAGDSLFRFIQGFFMASISQKIIKLFRKQLFNHLTKLSISFFDTRQNGDLMSRLTNDIDNVSTTISDSFTQLIQLCFTLMGVLCIMLYLNIWLTLVALIATPLIFVLTKTITKHTKVLFKQQQDILGRLNGHIEENISGILLVKAFSREETVVSEFEILNNQLCETGTKALIWSGYLMPIMNVINNLCFIFVAITGGFMAVKGYITVGIISSFLLYSRQFTRPLNELANIYNTLQSAVAGAERVFEIMDEQPEVADAKNAKDINSLKGELTFEDVVFGYQTDRPIIKKLSLRVEAGTKVAIVGSTGAGKTTIISLLARFYDVNSGRILLDGKDIREYKRKDLRSCFGVVLQDTALFNMSIMENIRYGRRDATDDDVIQAARSANAHSFITRLPEGYNTPVGDGGGTLSQGEKQLFTIARAILSNAPIMILDEATSSVDTRTERKIKQAVTRLTEGRTSFIIAHRLSTIRDCDLIVVLEHGEIAEAGNHKELMQQNGIYSTMYKTQTGL